MSHHEPAEWDRCHVLSVPGFDDPVRICARCAGVYPGMLTAILAVGFGPLPVLLSAIAILPLPALLDWSRSALAGRPGTNLVRTASGFLLGFGYGMGLVGLLIGDSRVLIVGIGLVYGLIALAGVLLDRSVV